MFADIYIGLRVRQKVNAQVKVLNVESMARKSVCPLFSFIFTL